jgi:hypothetical protein
MTTTELAGGPAAYAATEQHIRLIQTKQARLTEALIGAELQYIQAVSREHTAGSISWSELKRAYEVVRDGGLPGWFQRWQQTLPYSPQHMNRMVACTEIEEPSTQRGLRGVPPLRRRRRTDLRWQHPVLR